MTRPVLPVLVAACAATLVLTTGAPALALPPGGAGSDTPGTAASVSPTTLAPCETLSFSLSGFPAGETVYVKIDDGNGYGDQSVQGAGVVYKQAIPASGTVNGSFALPCGITAGTHWLRFLASAYVDPHDTSKGTVGYTHAGGTDFTVVAAASGSDGSAASGTGTAGRAASAAGGTAGSGAQQATAEGGVLSIPVDPSAAPSVEPSATATPTPAPTATDAAPAAAASPTASNAVPWVGIGVGAGLVAIAGIVVAVLLLRRRPAP